MHGSRFWHYTTLHHLSRIFGDGYIRRSSGGVSMGERQAVWFTKRMIWEPTATKMKVIAGIYTTPTLNEMQAAFGALVRIAVEEDVALYSWQHHRLLGGIDPRIADELESAALASGSDPREWHLIYRDVPVAQIRVIEMSNDGMTWRPAKQVADGWVLGSADHDDHKDLPRAS